MAEENKDTIKLYHYTNKEGIEGILDSGLIFESTESGTNDDANFGDGVYFTSLPPSTGKYALADNNYDGSEQNLDSVIDDGRVDHYIKVELDVDDVEKVENAKDDRDIYVYRGDLDLYDAIRVKTGDVVKP